MKTLMKAKAVVYTKPNCVQCNATFKALDKHGVKYETVDLLDHPEMVEHFKAQGHLAAPIVQTSSGTWAGYKPDKIKALAQQAA